MIRQNINWEKLLMAGTRPFLGTEISLDEIDYTVSIFYPIQQQKTVHFLIWDRLQVVIARLWILNCGFCCLARAFFWIKPKGPFKFNLERSFSDRFLGTFISSVRSQEPIQFFFKCSLQKKFEQTQNFLLGTDFNSPHDILAASLIQGYLRLLK